MLITHKLFLYSQNGPRYDIAQCPEHIRLNISVKVSNVFRALSNITYRTILRI